MRTPLMLAALTVMLNGCAIFGSDPDPTNHAKTEAAKPKLVSATTGTPAPSVKFIPGLPVFETTYEWLPAPGQTWFGAWAGWGNVQEWSGDFILPDRTLTYCRHSVAWVGGGPDTRGFFMQSSYADTAGYHMKFRVVGGPPWDQYGAEGKIGRVTVSGVPIGTSHAERQRLGCAAPTNATNSCACVKAGGDINAVRSCLQGSGRCDLMSDLTYQACVPDMGTCAMLQNAYCSNLAGRGFEHLYVADSPQCAR